MKNRENIKNVWKILPVDGSQKREVSDQNGRVGISEYLAYVYNFICGESVCRCGNRSTGEWTKRQGEGVHVTYIYILFHYVLNH